LGPNGFTEKKKGEKAQQSEYQRIKYSDFMSGLWWKVHDFILEANRHRSILSSQKHITPQTFEFSNFHTHLLLQELDVLCERERSEAIMREREDILPCGSRAIV
jgi:hypothetical protein